MNQKFALELKLKDVILKRYQNYSQVLKKELVYAKNIIKNPKLMEKWNMKLNFKMIDIYPYKRNQALESSGIKVRRLSNAENDTSDIMASKKPLAHSQSMCCDTQAQSKYDLSTRHHKSRVVDLNTSKYLTPMPSTDKVTRGINAESIKKLLKSQRSKIRHAVFQRRNHSVVGQPQCDLNVSEINNTKISSDFQ